MLGIRPRYWWLLTVAACTLMAYPAFVVVVILLFKDGDPEQRGMAGIHMTSRTEHSAVL